MQRPEERRLVLPVFKTRTTCCGSAAGYLLRRIAYRAGSYAPGIHDDIFRELDTLPNGASIDHVVHWFERRGPVLDELGYRLRCACVVMSPTALLAWIREGRGYRGAVMSLRPGADVPTHAVGVTSERVAPTSEDELVMVDPWRGAARDRMGAPPPSAFSHHEHDEATLALHWVGWS